VVHQRNQNSLIKKYLDFDFALFLLYNKKGFFGKEEDMKYGVGFAVAIAIFFIFVLAGDFLYAPAEKEKHKEEIKGEWEAPGGHPDILEPGTIDKVREPEKRPAREFEHPIHPGGAMMMPMERIKKEDPEKYELMVKDEKLQRKINEIVGQYWKPDSDREKIKNELESAVKERFEVRIQIKKHDIEILKKELARQEQVLQNWEKDKDSFIQKKMKELVGEQREEEPF
jgi:hypothetical protein